MGPRIGRFKQSFDGNIKSHNVPMVAIGFFVLTFGFLAFNGGSQAAIANPGDSEVVAEAFMATAMSCCSGGITTLVTLRFLTGYWRMSETINGCLAGMVSVCCGCDAMAPWAAAVSGCFASSVHLGVSYVMKKFKIDDPIDAVAVHGAGGKERTLLEFSIEIAQAFAA